MLKAALFSESLLMFSGISGEGWLLRRGRHIHGVSGHRPNAAVLPRAVQRRLPGKSGQKPPTNVADRGVQKIGVRFFQDVVWSVFGWTALPRREREVAECEWAVETQFDVYIVGTGHQFLLNRADGIDDSRAAAALDL